MFEIIKVINSTVPTVEPERLGAQEGFEAIYGCALVKSDGKLSVCNTAQTPMYICGTTQMDADGSILVYPVRDNIVFLAPIKCESYGNLNKGCRVSVLMEDGAAVAVIPDAEGVGEITDLADKAGYVYVKFTN